MRRPFDKISIALRWLTGMLLFLCCNVGAQAHSMPGSGVYLDFEPHGIAVELVLPLIELELSFKQPLSGESTTVISKHGEELKKYIREYFHPSAPDGREWEVAVGAMEMRTTESIIDLAVQVYLRPPPGSPVRQLDFNYQVICHEVNNHYAYVMVRKDWNTGKFSGDPENLGMIQYTIRSLRIDRSENGSWWEGFRIVLVSAFDSAWHHFEWMLFLLAIFLRIAQRTNDTSDQRAARIFSRGGKVVGMLLAGCVIGLTLGVGKGWLFHNFCVNVLCGLVLLAAINAVRPIFRGKEMCMSACVGILLGWLLAETVAAFGYTLWYLNLSIAAFAVVIGVMAVLEMVIILPGLMFAARFRWYARFSLVLAILIGLAEVVLLVVR